VRQELNPDCGRASGVDSLPASGVRDPMIRNYLMAKPHLLLRFRQETLYGRANQEDHRRCPEQGSPA
jgi:hypothetical protein